MGSFRKTGILIGKRPTSPISRFAARAIDVVLIAAVYYFVSSFWPWVAWGLAFLICAFQDGMGAGQSVGKRILGLRVLDDPTALPCSYHQSLLRNYPFALAVLLSAIPMFWVFSVLVVGLIFAFEIYLLVSLESGARLGDVLGNTRVVEVDPQEIVPILD